VIAIVDTGGANIASVRNALGRLGYASELTDDVARIQSASHVILPGVGAAGSAMARIRGKGLFSELRALCQPTLGICLGMQLLFSYSEEGDASCLDVISGKVVRLDSRANLPVPHMGWNRVSRAAEKASALLEGIPEGAHFYFVHGYVAPGGEHVAAEFEYGAKFPAVVSRANFFGVQFHPERSGECGAKLLRNFLSL
jgi:glutamine amidotransferase